MNEAVMFKRVWDKLAREKTAQEAAFGPLIGRKYSRDCDARDLGIVEGLVQPGVNDRVLDVGCGGLARALNYFGAKKLQIVGVDVSPAALAEANKVLKRVGVMETVSLVAADAESLPFRADTFDKVLALGVIVHFPTKASVLRALKEIRYCMKNGAVGYFNWWLNLYSFFSSFLTLATRVSYIQRANRIQLLNFRGSGEIREICAQSGLVTRKIINGSILWYIIYLLPTSVQKWVEKLSRVLEKYQDLHPGVSFLPYSFDLVTQKATFKSA